MPRTVLIVSVPHDLHAHALHAAIEEKGARSQILYATDFPERAALTILPSRAGTTLVLNDGKRWELGAQCASVCLRRTSFAQAPSDFEEEDRETIERECRHMWLSYFDLLCPLALWVNPLRGQETAKPTQLVAALRCGFKIPATIVSNDPSEILAFVRGAPGPVVYKTFGAIVPTTVVTDDLLAEPDLLRWTPGIYQHYVLKDHELRVTVIGRRLFAVRINSQATARGQIDWREAQRTPRGKKSDLTLEPAALPAAVEVRCLRLMKALGLVYGAIDLIVTPQKEYVFLEVNPSGQFLWIESALGLPLLDAMSELLIQGTPQYDWNPHAPHLRFDADFEKAVETRQAEILADRARGPLPEARLP